MAEFDIRIITRHDFLSNWESSGSKIKRGEIAVAFSGEGAPLELKIGIGQTWSNTPIGLIPFKPILVNGGRNLDTPTLRNVNWDLKTLDDALQAIFAPYVAPGISISPNTFGLQEVGDTLTIANQSFNAGLLNIKNILIEGDKKIYIDNVPRALLNQNASSGNEIVIKTITANRNTSGSVSVLTVAIKDSKSAAFISASANVPFNFRVGFFLVKTSEDVFIKTDLEITDLIKNNALSNITGIRTSSLGANQNFGQRSFITGNVPVNDLSSNGRYNLYVYTPETMAIPVFSTPGDESTPIQDKTSKLFQYTNGTASTSFRITKLGTTTTSTIAGGEILNIN